MTSDPTEKKIFEATFRLYQKYGIRFTMDQLSSELSMSKKTIYVYFPDKTSLFHQTVDYIFDCIKEEEASILQDERLELKEKLRRLLGAMPHQYQGLEFQHLYVLKEKYPAIYRHVTERLEGEWEPTLALLQQGITEGVFRPFSLPIFKTMMEATLEQFFQRDILVANQISYQDALREVVDLLLDGIFIKPE